MISENDIKDLKQQVKDFWVNLLSSEEGYKTYYKRASGKEPGHKLSDEVDETTTQFIKETYPERCGYQTRNGKRLPRSMGDIWFKNEKDEWNPINVKTGLTSSKGQPNIVSLKKVMASIMNHTIDSYYILLVKFQVDTKNKTISPSVYLTDILNWLSLPEDKAVVNFDSGPGQMMLNAKHFYNLLSKGEIPQELEVWKKMELLMALYRDGEKRLKENREKDLKKFEACYNNFMPTKPDKKFTIDKEEQQKFGIES